MKCPINRPSSTKHVTCKFKRVIFKVVESEIPAQLKLSKYRHTIINCNVTLDLGNFATSAFGKRVFN